MVVLYLWIIEEKQRVDHEEKGKYQGRAAGIVNSSPRRMPQVLLFLWKLQMSSFLLSTKQAHCSCLKDFILLTGYWGKQDPVMWIVSGLLVKALQKFVQIMQESSWLCYKMWFSHPESQVRVSLFSNEETTSWTYWDLLKFSK